MSELPIKATLKAGKDFDAPWVTVDAADPNDLEFKLRGLIDGTALSAVVEAANALKGANNAAPLVAGGAEAAAPAAPVQQAQPAGWGNSPAAAAPQWSGAQQQAAPTGKVNGAPHPEGIVCPVDGVPVVFKQTPPRRSDGKSFQFWSCPNQKSKDDGHYSAFAN